MVSNDGLVKRIADLERELAELKAQLKPREPFKPRFEMPRFDPTEGMRMGPDAAQAMARVVPDVKGQKFSEHAWSQTRMYGPGGFGPPPERMAQMDKETGRRKEEPQKPVPAQDTRSPQTRIFDDMVDYWAGGPNDSSKLK